MSELTEQIRATCGSIADNQKKVYDLGFEQGKKLGGYNEGFEAGKKSQYDEFWDAYQNYGKRISYSHGFAGAGFNSENFYPKYDIKPTGYSSNVFYAWETTKHKMNLKERLIKCGVVLDTSKVTNMTSMFSYGNFGTIPTIDCTGLLASSTNVFSYNYTKTTEIEKIITKESVTYANWFLDSYFTEIRFEGVIGQDINFQWSTNLSKASWISIMTAASTTASITITGSLESVNKAFETSPGANDGSTSPEWFALKAARPTVSVSLV